MSPDYIETEIWLVEPLARDPAASASLHPSSRALVGLADLVRKWLRCDHAGYHPVEQALAKAVGLNLEQA